MRVIPRVRPHAGRFRSEEYKVRIVIALKTAHSVLARLSGNRHCIVDRAEDSTVLIFRKSMSIFYDPHEM